MQLKGIDHRAAVISLQLSLGSLETRKKLAALSHRLIQEKVYFRVQRSRDDDLLVILLINRGEPGQIRLELRSSPFAFI